MGRVAGVRGHRAGQGSRPTSLVSSGQRPAVALLPHILAQHGLTFLASVSLSVRRGR